MTGDDGKATSTEFQITQEWYYLKESIAPPGYELSTTVIPVKPKNGATLTVGPVSYTHLDVYKRQSQFTSMIVRQSSPWQMHILQLRVQAYRYLGKLL